MAAQHARLSIAHPETISVEVIDLTAVANLQVHRQGSAFDQQRLQD
ncbi:hypothetical protein Q427_11415 [Halomonas sp. BC04]|nr:hypothetical protein Q427_11415 [Halomonas sp. BC04]